MRISLLNAEAREPSKSIRFLSLSPALSLVLSLGVIGDDDPTWEVVIDGTFDRVDAFDAVDWLD